MALKGNRPPTSWPTSHLIQSATQEKLTGSFYTPPEIARFILRWAFNGRSDFEILEPCCGDGIFLKELLEANYPFANLTALELDPSEARKAREIGLERSTVKVAEFHEYCSSTFSRFDLVVGNPPFIRYQFFDEEQRALAEGIFTRAGLRYTRLANPWISFLVGSCLLLKRSGKIGMVLPAEVLQVGYAKQVRQFMARFFNKICIVSFEKLLFDDVEQEVVLLLCERTTDDSHRIDHFELKDASQLAKLNVSRFKAPQKRLNFHANKWTYYFLDQEQIDFLESMSRQFGSSTLGKFATVEVGITTGMNPFFTVNADTVGKYGLKEFASPMVGRSVQVEGARFTKDDWKANVQEGARAYFLRFPRLQELGERAKARDYIADGEKAGFNKGYKCRIRDEWQIVPSAWVPPALFLRRNHLFPRFVVNDASAYTTDTMHRVVPHEQVEVTALVASYYNSLSFASAEVCGRSHGGGVLELMPNEAEQVIVPYREENASLLPRIDAALRDDIPISEILEFTNKQILSSGQGLSESQIELATRVWQRLMGRRLARHHG